jgi:hypothetical protein
LWLSAQGARGDCSSANGEENEREQWRGGGSHHEWRRRHTKLSVEKTQNAADSEKLGRSGELKGHEDTSAHSLDY